jgi:peptidoglycan/LPS O-acetylase OafA/YrhL
VGRFIIRRGFKIWPSYFTFLAGICLIRVFLLHEPWHHLRLLKPNLFHIQNYAGAVYAPHTWSLAVEEHFYLALPFLLVLLVWRRKTPLTSIPGLPAIALLVFVGCAVLRSLTPAPRVYEPGFHFLGQTHLRLDGLFLGVLLAYLQNFKPHTLRFASRFPNKLFWLGIALLTPYPETFIGNRALAISLELSSASLGYGCILLAMGAASHGEGWIGKFTRSGPARVLAFVGLFSYPIYLWHIDASRLVRVLMPLFGKLSPVLRFEIGIALYLLAAIAAGILFEFLMEKPSLALRDRLFPARAKAVADPPVLPQGEQAASPPVALEGPLPASSVT